MNENVNRTLINDLIVVKRSGQRVSFNSTKIAIAIKNAFDQASPNDSEKKVNKVYEDVVLDIAKNYENRKTINVEDIQDIIERKLEEDNFKDVYESFRDYRIRRAASRQAFGLKHQHKFTKAIERIINDNEENKYLNGNPNEILLNFGKTISCEYTKTYILDNKLERAHEEGSIYIHNLDYFNLGKLSSTHLMFEKTIDNTFPNGFIQLALNAKNEIDGEIGIDRFDYLLKPLIISKFQKRLKILLDKYLTLTYFKDYINIEKLFELIDKENSININIERFEEFILNNRVKGVFNLAIDDANYYIRYFLEKSIEDILINLNNNTHENKKYSISIGSSNSYECIIINNIYLDKINALNTLNNITTIFKIKEDTTEELLNKVSELVLNKKNVAFAFDTASYNKNENETIEYFSDGKRIFENPIYDTCVSTGRMITSAISINMGRLGLKYQNKPIQDFYENFDELLEITKNGLISIFEVIGNKAKKNYRVIFNNNIIDDDKLEIDQKIRKVIKKGVLNLELAGLRECVIALTEDPKKQKELLKEIGEYANDKCHLFTQDSKLNFVLSETCKSRPLRKLMELDKAIYGIRKNITDKSMYGRLDTLFGFKKDMKTDLKYIGEYQKIFDGGNFIKIELSKNSKTKNVLEIINTAKECDVGFIKIVVGGK